MLLKQPAIKVWLSTQFLTRFDNHVTVTAGSLNARAAASLDSAVLTQLGRGTTAKILAEKEGFVQVYLNSDFAVAIKSEEEMCVSENSRYSQAEAATVTQQLEPEPETETEPQPQPQPELESEKESEKEQEPSDKLESFKYAAAESAVWLSLQFVELNNACVSVTGDALNARSAPRLNARIVQQLARGTTGRLLSQQDGFAEVVLDPSNAEQPCSVSVPDSSLPTQIALKSHQVNEAERESSELDKQRKVWLSEQFVTRRQGCVTVNVNTLNARSAASLDSAVIVQLSHGTSARLLAERDGFVQVELRLPSDSQTTLDNLSCIGDRSFDKDPAQQTATQAQTSAPSSAQSSSAATPSDSSISNEQEVATEQADAEAIALYTIVLSKEGDEKPTLLSDDTFVLLRAGRAMLDTDILNSAQVEIPEGTGVKEFNDLNYVLLDDLEAVSYSVDESSQTLKLLVAASGYTQSTLSGAVLSDHLLDTSDNMHALFTDYRVSVTGSESDPKLGLFLKPGFTFRKSTLTGQFINTDITGEGDFQRLETSWVRDFQKSKIRLSVGDAVSTLARGSPNIGSSYRFGGVQIGTNFSLNPFDITYPLPTLYGEAATKSAVELYIDDALTYRGTTREGPFVLEQPPLRNGSGTVRMVVRDLLGRESVVSRSFDIDTRLLAPGLIDWQLNAGVLRDGSSSERVRYGDSFGAFRARRGFTNFLTAQATAEYSESHQLFGASASLLLPKLGLLSLGTQHSSADDLQGNRVNYSLRKTFDRFSYSVQGFESDQEFRNLGRLDSLTPTESQLVISLGTRFSDKTQGSLSHVTRSAFDGTDVEISRILLTRNMGDLGRLSFSAGLIKGREFVQIDDQRHLGEFTDYSILFNYAVSFAKRRRALLTHQYRRKSGTRDFKSNRVTATFRKSIPLDLGTGYSASLRYEDANSDAMSDATFNLRTNTRYGHLRANARIDDDQSYSYYSEFEGSLIFTERSVLAQRPLNSGFVLVNLENTPNVTVYRENRPSAVTNSKGLAVVPRLQPYSRNRISVKSNDFPIEASITNTDVQVVPRLFGAVSEDFGLRYSVNQLIQLVDTNQRPIPLGASVESPTILQNFWVGYDGEVYLTDLLAINQFIVRYTEQQCKFQLNTGDLKPNEKLQIECLPIN